MASLIKDSPLNISGIDRQSYCHAFVRRFHHGLGGDTEFLEDLLLRAGGAKTIHTHKDALTADVLVPTQVNAGLDTHAMGKAGTASNHALATEDDQYVPPRSQLLRASPTFLQLNQHDVKHKL